MAQVSTLNAERGTVTKGGAAKKQEIRKRKVEENAPINMDGREFLLEKERRDPDYTVEQYTIENMAASDKRKSTEQEYKAYLYEQDSFLKEYDATVRKRSGYQSAEELKQSNAELLSRLDDLLEKNRYYRDYFGRYKNVYGAYWGDQEQAGKLIDALGYYGDVLSGERESLKKDEEYWGQFENEWQYQLATRTMTYDGAQEDVAATERQIEENDRLIEELQKRQRTLDKEVKDLQLVLTGRQTGYQQMISINQELQDKQAEMKSIPQQIEELENRKPELQNRILTDKAYCGQFEDEWQYQLATRTMTRDGAQEDIAVSERQIEENDRQIEELQERQRALAEEVSGLQTVLINRQTGYDQMVSIGQEVRDKQAEMKSASQQIEELENKNAELQNRILTDKAYRWDLLPEVDGFEEDSRYIPPKEEPVYHEGIGATVFSSANRHGGLGLPGQYTTVYSADGFEDMLYDYINGNPIARKVIDGNDNGMMSGTDSHAHYKDLPEDIVKRFNWLYKMESPEAAYEYIDTVTDKQYTPIRVFLDGIMYGAGSYSIAETLGAGVANLLNDDEMKKEASDFYNDTQKQLAEEREQHPAAFAGGNISGNLMMMYALSSAIGKGTSALGMGKGTTYLIADVGGKQVQVALSPVVQGIVNNTLTFATADAVRNAGAFSTGNMSAEDYWKSVGISGIQGLSGGMAEGLVNTGLAVKLTRDGTMTPFLEFVRQTSSGLAGATVNTNTGYALRGETPSNEQRATDFVTAFLFSTVRGAISSYKTTQAEKANMESLVSALETEYAKMTQGWKTMDPAQRSAAAQSVIDLNQQLRTAVNGTYLAGQQGFVNETNAYLDTLDGIMEWYANGGQWQQGAGSGALPGGAGNGALPGGTGGLALGTAGSGTGGEITALQKQLQTAMLQGVSDSQANGVVPVRGGALPSLELPDKAPGTGMEQASHSPEMQKVMAEYEAAVDPELLRMAEKYRENPNASFERKNISPVSQRQQADLERILGSDFSGYTNAINKSSFIHIEKRHGIRGEADRSMANLEDVARVGYVLDNYDTVEQLFNPDGTPELSAEFRNKNDEPAYMIKYSKRVDGTVYVIEAAADNAYKKLWVVSTYKNRAEDITQAPNAANAALGTTSETPLASLSSAEAIISGQGQNVNSWISDEELLRMSPMEALLRAQTGGPRQESDNSLPEDMELKLSPMEAAARAGRQQQLEQLPQIQQQSSEMAGERDWTQLYESAIKYGVPLKKVNQVRQLAEMFGSKVEFYSSEDLGEHGFRSPDGVLHINANSPNPMEQIIGHELTHSLEGTDSYGKLQQLVFDRITETGGDLTKMREEKKAQYAEHGHTLNDRKADREIIAEYMERDLLTDKAAIRFLVHGDKKLGQRIRDGIDRILAKLGDENAREQASLARARQMYSAALQESRDAATKARQADETDSLGERTQLPISEEAYSGKDLSQDKSLYTYEFLTALPDMQTVTLAELSDVRNENGRIETAIVMEKGMKNALSNGYEQDGMVFVRNNYTGRPLRITAECIRHGLNGKANRLITNARLCAVVGDVIKNAVPINALHNKAKDVTGTYAMAAYATDSDGREFVVVATIEQHNDKVSEIEVFDTVHAVSGRQKRGGQASEPHTSSRAKTLSNLSSISISDFLDIVKNTHQSLLSEDVLAHFGEVRNPEGQYTKDAKFSISTEQPAETEYDSPEDVPEAQLPTFPADENSYDPQDLHNWGDLRELELPMFNPEDAPYIPGREPKSLNDSADLRELQLPMFLADEESNGSNGENRFSIGGLDPKRQQALDTAISMLDNGRTPSEVYVGTDPHLVVMANGDIREEGSMIKLGEWKNGRAESDEGTVESSSQSSGTGNNRRRNRSNMAGGSAQSRIGRWEDLSKGARRKVTAAVEKHMQHPTADGALLLKRYRSMEEFTERFYSKLQQGRIVAEDWSNFIPDIQGLMDEIEDLLDGENQYSFGGEHAKKRDQSMLETAIALEAEGEDSEAIRRETGWFRGMDGKWRFEIDDSRMKLKNFDPDKGADEIRQAMDRLIDAQEELIDKSEISEEQLAMVREYKKARKTDPARAEELYRQLSESNVGELFRKSIAAQEEYDAAKEKNGLTLGDVITHPTLFRNYPELREIPIKFPRISGDRGSYDGESICLSKNLMEEPEELRASLLHEIQHAVQDREGFAGGSSPEYWREKLEDGYSRRWNIEGRESEREMRSWDLYRNTAGELEARNVSDRMQLSPEERTEILPDLGDENTVFAEDDGQNTLWAEESGVSAENGEEPFTSEPKRGTIQERNMAMGLRRSQFHVLTEDEIASVKADAEAIGIPLSMLRFNTGSRTGFSDKFGDISICGDILPDLSSNIARDRMSQRAVLAHEYYGHWAHHPSEYDYGDWRDEFRASYDAAINAPGLSDEDRALLMSDAYDRAREAGVDLNYDETARRIIFYGF